MNEKYFTLTTKDVIGILGFSQTTLSIWAREKRLQCIKVKNRWLFNKESVIDTKLRKENGYRDEQSAEEWEQREFALEIQMQMIRRIADEKGIAVASKPEPEPEPSEEIKYREWNEDEKRFLYVTEEDFDGSFKKKGRQYFTGLLDKNGNEIYDGDFIKEDIDYLSLYTQEELESRTDEELEEEIEGFKSTPDGVVKYDDSESEWVLYCDDYGSDSYLDSINNPEVFGNVYENEVYLKVLPNNSEYKPKKEKKKREESKFRIWDGKKMIYVTKDSGFQIIFEENDWELKYRGETYCTSNQADCKLMQFSEITDVNGKEIYEDDIVKYSEEYASKFADEYDGFIGVCKFRDVSGWGIEEDPECLLLFYCFDVDGDPGEVVGNIHENEALLKELFSELYEHNM